MERLKGYFLWIIIFLVIINNSMIILDVAIQIIQEDHFNWLLKAIDTTIVYPYGKTLLRFILLLLFGIDLQHPETIFNFF